MKKIGIIVFFCLFISCGSRKSEVEISKIETTTKSIDTTRITHEINASLVDISRRFRIVPQDTSKPITIGKIPVKNGIIEYEEKYKKDTISKKDTKKAGINKENTTKSKTKQKETSTNNIWWIIGIITVAILIILIKKPLR